MNQAALTPAPTDWDALYPSQRWLKTAFKAPILLWRLGLGPLLGHIFVLITHIGRKSGLPRRTVTEWHPFGAIKVAPCAWGERSQWYRNIQADPLVTIQTKDGAQSCRARRISDPVELRRAVEAIRARNAMMMDGYLRSLGIDPDDPADLTAKADRLTLIAFDPTDQPTPPPLEVDLAWMWPVALLTLLLLRAARPRRR
mgnify:CR=1 FL=1